MTIKETEIETLVIEHVAEKIRVCYSDELTGTTPFDLSHFVGDYLPYLFVGYFTDGKEFKQWFFSNARRHQDMKEAIESDLQRKLDYTYGQLWLDRSSPKNRKFQYYRLELHSALPDAKEALHQLHKVIDPNFLTSNFSVTQVQQGRDPIILEE